MNQLAIQCLIHILTIRNFGGISSTSTWKSVIFWIILLQFLSFYQMTPLHVAGKTGRYGIVESLTTEISAEDNDGVSVCYHN